MYMKEASYSLASVRGHGSYELHHLNKDHGKAAKKPNTVQKPEESKGEDNVDFSFKKNDR